MELKCSLGKCIIHSGHSRGYRWTHAIDESRWRPFPLSGFEHRAPMWSINGEGGHLQMGLSVQRSCSSKFVLVSQTIRLSRYLSISARRCSRATWNRGVGGPERPHFMRKSTTEQLTPALGIHFEYGLPIMGSNTNNIAAGGRWRVKFLDVVIASLASAPVPDAHSSPLIWWESEEILHIRPIHGPTLRIYHTAVALQCDIRLVTHHFISNGVQFDILGSGNGNQLPIFPYTVPILRHALQQLWAPPNSARIGLSRCVLLQEQTFQTVIKQHAGLYSLLIFLSLAFFL